MATTPKTKSVKKLKLNIFNIKSLLVFNRKKLAKIKGDKKKFSLFQIKKKQVEEKEGKIESPLSIKSALKTIGLGLLSKPMSIIDKFKEFFGIILLGILVNNLPKIIKELQKVLGKIKKFFDNNPWIGKVLKISFDIIAKGMMGILDLTKSLMPVIGGSFKFALDTIKTAGNEIGKLINFFDDLSGGIGAVMTSFGYKPPAKAAQAYAKSKGKYYSNTTGKTYANYRQAVNDPRVNKAIQQRAQKAQTAPARGYDPNKGITNIVNIGNKSKGSKQMVVAPLTTGYGANRKTQYLFKDPNNLNARPIGLKANDPGLKPAIQRYQAVSQADKIQKLSIGGTIRNFFSGMFGGSRRGLGNIPSQEGSGRGGPSDIKLTTKSSSSDGGRTYLSPYATPGGTARGRKARETVNYFKIFERTVDQKTNNLLQEEKNLSLFSEFIKSYENLSKLRKKYGDLGLTPRTTSPIVTSPSDEAISVDTDEVIGTVGKTGRSFGAHIHIEDFSTPGAAIPNSVKSSILVAGKPMTSGTMTSGIGMRWGRPHNGEDWDQNWENKNISLTGGLKFVRYVPMGSDPRFDGYGNVVVIQAPDNKKYFLGHLNAGPSNLAGLLKRQQQQLAQKVPGGSNEEKIWNYFRAKGLSEVAVSGILGNASIESSFNPTVAHSVRGNGGKFIGIFQWDNKISGDRWGNLKKWAKSRKKDPENIDTQLQFTWVEMTDTGSPYYDSKSGEGYVKIQSAKTPEEAARIWHGYFERASAPAPIREKEAAKLYKKWKGKTVQKVQPILSPTQKLEKNIVAAMGGKPSITVGDKTVSVEKKDGKDVIKVTTGGLFGIGAKQLKLDEKLLNDLLYEIRNKMNNKPGKTPVQPIKQGGIDSGSGIDNSASITIIDRTTVALVTQPINQPIPVDNPVPVPILISQNYRPERELV